MGMTIRDKITDEVIEMKAGEEPLFDIIERKLLRWFEHVKRTEEELRVPRRSVHEMEMEGRRQRGSMANGSKGMCREEKKTG